MFILDLESKFFSILDPGSRVEKIPDPGSGSASKNLNILTQNIVSKLRNRNFHPRSRIRILIFNPSLIPDPGVKKAPEPGSESTKLCAISLPRNKLFKIFY
jgi:hypothetical protein